MKHTFEYPSMQVMYLKEDDILTASGGNCNNSNEVDCDCVIES